MATWRTQVRHDGTYVGGPGYNVFHFRDGDSGDPLADLERASAALLAMYTAASVCFPAASTFVHEGEWLNIADSTVLATDGWERAGAGGGEYLPSQTCLVIGWQTSVRTRSGRGRTFMGPVSDVTMEGNGTPSEAQRAAMQAAGQLLVTELDGLEGGSFGVYSPTEGVIRDITTARVRNVYAHLTTRRR